MPIPITLKEFIASCGPARDELIGMMKKAKVPLAEAAASSEPKIETKTSVLAAEKRGVEHVETDDGGGDYFYVLGSGKLNATVNGIRMKAIVDDGFESTFCEDKVTQKLGLEVDKSIAMTMVSANKLKQPALGVCHKAKVVVAGVEATVLVFTVEHCSSELILGRTWLTHVNATTENKRDGSQTVTIDGPEGSRVTLKTVNEFDKRHKVSLQKKGQLKTRSCQMIPEEVTLGPHKVKGAKIEIEDLEGKYVIDGMAYEKEVGDDEFGGYAKPARIYTVPHVSWNDAGWKFAQKKKEMIVDFLKEKIRTFVAEPCESAYVNKWFFIWKSNGRLRWIQDLQKTNKVTVRDVGSIPNADLLSEGAAGRSIYSVCDLFSGYDEIPLDYRNRHLTAMHTPLGLIQMMVVPMGWTNGVAVFQRAMVAVLGELIPNLVEVFLDDFPIKGPYEKDETEVRPGVRWFVATHAEDIKKMLVKLEDANLTISGTKSRWAMSSIKIVGYICDKEGRRPDPAKLEKLMNWPTPLRHITDIRQFSGVVGFWKNFIKGYAGKAKPLRRLLRKGVEWSWTSEQEDTSRALKDEFKEGGQVLGVPYFEDEEKRPFVVCTDAGPAFVGGVLAQKDQEGRERPLRFESKTLNTTDRNYSQFKKEVLGVLHCLNVFRHYIYGRRFVLRVDPTAVATVLQKDFSLTDPTITRWLMHIRMFDYMVERISGAKNSVADGLSRIALEEGNLGSPGGVDKFLQMEIDSLRVEASTARTPLFLENLYTGKYQRIDRYLIGEAELDDKVRKEAQQYCLRAGHLFKRPPKNGMPMRVVCDRDEQRDIIAELHDGVVEGHRGVKGTFEKVRNLYWWDGLYRDVEVYCLTCVECQKRVVIKYKEPLFPSYPTAVGQKVHVDLVNMPKGEGGMNYIIDIRDDLTGFVEAWPLKQKTGKAVSGYLTEYITWYGCVGKIVMDRGSEFMAKEVQELLQMAGIRVSLSTAYHPQTNAPVERGHQSLVNALAKWCEGREKK
ncbi:hypothetical protein CBR_g48508 [Chara braunii]|uniref:RNA-directed DNA polymerase n=1 Tax=Chara braunii TaxID=69332 RepID=A0A388M2X7_CHABU|nr:hypothetical protein CBR_g48508 [Chara braunii]|eukprot:GBG88896.1 hypothetical protein CBR_g48508 [Chara braunii]